MKELSHTHSVLLSGDKMRRTHTNVPIVLAWGNEGLAWNLAGLLLLPAFFTDTKVAAPSLSCVE